MRVGAVSIASSSLSNVASSSATGADQLKPESRPESGRLPGQGSSLKPAPNRSPSSGSAAVDADLLNAHAASAPSRTSGISSNHHARNPLVPEAALVAGAAGVWDVALGGSRPDSDDARSAGWVLNSLVASFHEISPPLKVWLTVSPDTVCSPVGAPKVPVAPPSLAQAALIAPRTTIAPVSGVQKITGLSGALNELIRLLGTPPSDSVPIGKPRSPVAPPSDSYFDRIAPVTA